MSIVSTVIVSDITEGSVRRVRYRCTDSDGGVHEYGPVITVDPAFDADTHMAIVATKVGAALADQEFEQVIAE